MNVPCCLWTEPESKSSHEVIILRLPVAFAYFYFDFFFHFPFPLFFSTIYILHALPPLSFIFLYFWASHFLVAFTLVCYLSHLVCIV